MRKFESSILQSRQGLRWFETERERERERERESDCVWLCLCVGGVGAWGGCEREGKGSKGIFGNIKKGGGAENATVS